jgi:hypothetical protein
METLVSFKVAKLAKKKGFDVPVNHFYTVEKKIASRVFDDSENWNNIPVVHFLDHNPVGAQLYTLPISSPSQAVLQKWIREKLNVSIKVDDFYTNSRVRYDYSLCKLGAQEDNPRGIFVTYEEALEKALYEAMKFDPEAQEDLD